MSSHNQINKIKKINEKEWGKIVSQKKSKKLTPEELARILAERKCLKNVIEKEENKNESEIKQKPEENTFKQSLNKIFEKIKSRNLEKKPNYVSRVDKYLDSIKDRPKKIYNTNKIKLLSQSMEKIVNSFSKSQKYNMTFREKVYEFDKNEQIKADKFMEQKRKKYFEQTKKVMSNNQTKHKNKKNKENINKSMNEIFDGKLIEFKEKPKSSNNITKKFQILFKCNSAKNINVKLNEKNTVIKENNQLFKRYSVDITNNRSVKNIYNLNNFNSKLPNKSFSRNNSLKNDDNSKDKSSSMLKNYIKMDNTNNYQKIQNVRKIYSMNSRNRADKIFKRKTSSSIFNNINNYSSKNSNSIYNNSTISSGIKSFFGDIQQNRNKKLFMEINEKIKEMENANKNNKKFIM